MDFLVKVAETGVAFPYTNVPTNEKISFLQARILSDTKIEIKDQVLITKKGYKLQPTDTLATLESENLFQTTVHSTENLLKPVFNLYVFDQRKFSDKNSARDKHAPYFFDSNENLKNYLLEAKIIDKDYLTDFQAEPSTLDVLENINKDYPGILETESKLFGHFVTIKKKFLQYKSRSKKLQRLMEESQNQIQSFDVLLKHASLVYKQCKGKKNDVLKRFTQDQEKNLLILKKFEEGLENLKKVELHEALQTEKQKTLMDIYYSPEAMFKWRNSCLELQNNIKNRIERSAALIKTVKKKLTDEKERSTETVTSHMQNVALDPSIQESEQVLLALLLKAYGEYKTLRDALERFSENDGATELADPKWKNLDDKVWEEEVAVFIKNLEKIDKALDQIGKMKMNFEMPIIVAYNTIMRYAGELTMISNEKMKQLNEEVAKMERDFIYLLNPSQLPSSYKSALAEVSRRKEFASTVDRKYKKLRSIIDTETEKRKKFLAQNGKILPSDFIPQLKNMPPVLTIENLDVDANLPNITNIPLTERKLSEDRKAPTSGSKSDRSDGQKSREEEEEIRALRRKMEELVKEFGNQKDRNNQLKAKLNQVEKEQLSSSMKKEIAKEDKIRVRENKELKEDLDQLTQVVNKCLGLIEVHDTGVNGFEVVKDKENSPAGDKLLQQKVEALTAMVESVSKTSFGVFSRQLSEKQKRFDTIKERYESLLMKAEEDLQKKISGLEAYYGDKMKEVSHKYGDAQKRVMTLLEDSKRYQKEINELKADANEKGKYYHAEMESAKKDIKIKLDLLKSKDEIIRSLSDMKNNQAKDVAELQDKAKKLEQKMKAEQAEAIANLHHLHKEEIESFKTRVKGLERDFSNKKIEVEKLVFSLAQCEKELRQKDEHARKQEGSISSLNEKITKMHDEITSYKNKVDNMELALQKKTAEHNTATKTVNQLTSEKNTLSTDLATYKEFNGELTKKVQGINEAWKKSENERKTLKTENERLTLEIDKKQVEIQSLQDQIAQINKERKEQVEKLSQITEGHEAERAKISELQEELNQKSIEVNTLKTKLDILSLDLDNKVKDNTNLTSKGDFLEKEKERLEEELQTIKRQYEKEKNTVRELEKKAEDLKTVCEQMQIELDVKTEKCEELKRCANDLIDKVERTERSWNECVKDNEILFQQHSENNTATNNKIQGLNERIMQLEEELRCKNVELKEKEEDHQKFTQQSSQVKAQADELAAERDREQKSLKEKEDLIKGFEEEIASNKKIIEELEKQGESYQEEARNKQTEINELREQAEALSLGNEKIKNENFLLNSDINVQKDKMQSLITKYETKAMSKLDYLRIEKGSKLLFIPYSEGIYVPFILHQYLSHEIETVMKTGAADLSAEALKKIESSIKPSFFLDLDSVNESYQTILKDCSLLIVATVKSIKSKMNKDINPKEPSLMIEVEKIEYMVGFEDEDMVLKNYAITMG